MLRTLFLIGMSLTVLSISQISSAEESAAFVARTVALQQKADSTTRTETVAANTSQSKNGKSKGC